MRRVTMAQIAGLLAVAATIFTPTSAEERPGCEGLSAQVRANYLEMRDGKLVPVCPVEPQAAREAADPCKQFGAQASQIYGRWSTAQEWLKRQRYKHMSVTVRDPQALQDWSYPVSVDG